MGTLLLLQIVITETPKHHDATSYNTTNQWFYQPQRHTMTKEPMCSKQRTLTTHIHSFTIKIPTTKQHTTDHAALTVGMPSPLSPSLHSSPFRTFPNLLRISLFAQFFQAYQTSFVAFFFVHTPTYKFALTFRTSLSHFCSQQPSGYRFSLFQCRYIS